MSDSVTVPASVGSRITAARRARGLTQRQLADALGTTPWAVDQLERDRANPERHLAAIADATSTGRDWLASDRLAQLTAGAAAPRLSARPVSGALDESTGRLLILCAITLLVTIRFFTEVVSVLPRAANFVDIPVFAILAGAALVAPPTRIGRSYLRVGGPALAFMLLAIASAIANVHRTHPAPTIVFVYGFLAPLSVYASVYRLWPAGNARSLSRLLVALGLLELAVVAVIDLPRFIDSGNPDDIAGTFGTNAYQLVVFLLAVAALLAGIFTLEPRRPIAPFAPLVLLAIFAVILAAQYRALLITTVVTMVAIGILLGRRSRGILAAALALVAFAASFSFVASKYPGLKLGGTADTLTERPWSYADQRFAATKPVRRLYTEDVAASVIGTGPGTFSSRAWQTFANADSTSFSNVQGGYAQRLVGGLYSTDVSERYVSAYAQTAAIVEGSRAVTSPLSSYLSLAAEVGLIGLLLLAGVYVAAFLRCGALARREIAEGLADDALPSLALTATVGFLLLLQIAVLENWLEVTRITFIFWAIYAVVAKEVDARQRGRP